MFLLANPKFTTIADAKRAINVSYLGGINISSKIMKNQKVNGQYTYIIYLAPSNTSGYNVCSHATKECIAGCLSTSGRTKVEIFAGVNTIRNARIKKTMLLQAYPQFFIRWLINDLYHYRDKAITDGFAFSVRLNGTSDVDYRKILIDGKNIFELFPDINFYDYTKNPDLFINKADNYHLTFSYTGRNWSKCEDLLNAGNNIAMVFNFKKGVPLPIAYKGYPIIDGDITDYRVADAKGVIVGLYWKNIADKKVNTKIKNSIFVIQPSDINLNY